MTKAYISGLPLHISAGAQNRYVSIIDHYVDHMVAEVKRELAAFYDRESVKKHIAALDSVDDEPRDNHGRWTSGAGESNGTIDAGGHELPLNRDGTVTLYHATKTKENADKIVKEKQLNSAGEPSIYLSTSKESTGYGDNVIAVKVDPNDLQLDDEFPNGRADYRIDNPRYRVKDAAIYETTGQDASDSVGSGIRILANAFKKQFDKLFGGLALTLSENMVADINKNSTTSLNASTKEINRKTEGEKLSIDPNMMDAATIEVLKASIARSTNFIRSIPNEYIANVNDAILSSIQTGNGLPDLIKYLDKQGNETKNWAHNTAMDQTRKTYNSLNASRMKNIGIKKGKWIHSGGSQHPRPLHVDYDGKTFDLNKGAPVGDNDGDYVMPGDDPNCRCTFTPILDDLFSSDED